MKLTVVSVYDVAAGAFGRPVFAVSSGAALRSFSDECNRNDKDNVMFHHPEHFILYEIGTWEDEFSKFDLLDRPKQLAIGSGVKI